MFVNRKLKKGGEKGGGVIPCHECLCGW